MSSDLSSWREDLYLQIQCFHDTYARCLEKPNPTPKPKPELPLTRPPPTPLDFLQRIPWDKSLPKRCYICNEAFLRKDNVLLTRCLHTYHPICIEEWLKVSTQCPHCKENVIKPSYR